MLNQGTPADQDPNLVQSNLSVNVSTVVSPPPTSTSAVPDVGPTSTVTTSIPVYNTTSDPIPTRLCRSGYSSHYVYYAVGRGLYVIRCLSLLVCGQTHGARCF